MWDQYSTIPAKKTKKSPAWLEKIQAKSAKGASILSTVFGLKKSRPKAFHSPCDNLHAVMGQKVMVILS
jgi:hypothetical protein